MDTMDKSLDAASKAVSDLFERIFGGSDDERQAIMDDLDGEMLAAGFTETMVSGAALRSGVASACSATGVAPAVQAGLGVQNVQVAPTVVHAAPVAPALPVLPPPPAQPTYPEVREYITNVTNTYQQYQDNDTFIEQTISNVDNSIDIDAVGVGGEPAYDEYGNPVPVIDIDIDQDNVTQTNSGDNSAQVGGDADNLNTGNGGVVNDADDLNVGGFGGGGFPAGDDNTVIITGDGSSGVGGDNYGNVESGEGDLTDIDAYNSAVATEGSEATLDQSTDIDFSVEVEAPEYPEYEEPGYEPEYPAYEAEAYEVPEMEAVPEPTYEPEAVTMSVEDLVAEVPAAEPADDMMEL